METVLVDSAQTTPNADQGNAGQTVVTNEAAGMPADNTAAQPTETQATEVPQETNNQTKETTETRPTVPTKYDLTLAEGSHLDAQAMERTAEYARTQGLSNEQAQALLDRESDVVASYVDAQKAQMQAKSDGWLNELSRDPEFGGDNFKRSAALAKRVVEKFGDQTLKQSLDTTKMGNYPPLVRMLVKIGNAISDDQLVMGNETTFKGGRSVEDVFYGSNN